MADDLLFCFTQILPKSYIHSSSLYHWLSCSSSSSPNFPNCSSPRESASVYASFLRFHFSASQPKTLRSRVIGYLSELRREPCALRNLTRPSAFLSLPLNFLRMPATSPHPLPLAQTKFPILR